MPGGPVYVPPASAGGSTDAADINIADAGGLYVATDVEEALAEAADYRELRQYLAPAGAAIETVPRTTPMVGQAWLVDGRVSLSAIALPKGFTVTNITFVSSSTGVSGASHCWFALCDEDHLQLRASADDTAASPWNASTAKTLALSSPFVTLYEGLYYVACMVDGTVGTTLVANNNNAGVYNIDPTMSIAGLTGQTVPVSDGTDLAPTPTKFGYVAYGYVS
jgi:hypothetical protein